MMDTKYWQSLGLCGLALFSSWTLAQENAPKWGPHVDVEAKPGNKRTLSEADVFLPLAQDARNLVFANLRGRFDNHDSREGNLGLGWRQMRENGRNLGLYGYFDRRRSPDTGYYYNQATLGVEALGPDWEFRANGYVPLGTKARDLGTVSTASLTGTSVQVTSINREERALKGFDAEVGWRTPLFDSEARRQLRLYLGGYRFSDAGVTVEGPRLRAELALDELPALGKGAGLFLGAEVQHDNARGDQSFLSLRLRIPLGKASEGRSALSAQERRMTAPIVRDVDIVTQSHVASTLVETVDASTPSAAVTVNGQAATVISSATTSGAALQAALTAAGNNSTVVLAGTFNTTAVTTLQTGQTLMGAANLVVTTPSGHTVTFATPGATISASASSALAMANGSTLSGMTINNTYNPGLAYAVAAQTINNVTIKDSVISANGTSGVYVIDARTTNNMILSGNTITSTATGGIGIQADSAVNITIAGNTFGTASLPSGIHGNMWTSFNAASTGNVANGTNCAFLPGAPVGSVGFDTITCP
ncbi:MAG: inverse autotransporter beta domain-containing protein [Sulfuricellaceae bacterium]|jgi:hypothetical protein